MKLFYRGVMPFLCITLAFGCGAKNGAILKSQNNQQTQVAIKQDGQEVLLTQTENDSIAEGYTVYNISKPKAQTVKDAPPAEVKAEKETPKTEPAVKTTPTTVSKPAVKETPSDKKEENKSVIIDKDGRLTHPWVLAKEVNPKDVPNEAPWFGEILTFEIGWSFVTAGEAQIFANKIIEYDGRMMYEIKTLAKSHSVIDKLFKVRDINTSWLDFDLSKSHGYWQSVREGRYARDEWIVFDYKAKKFKANKKNRKDELSYNETDLKKDGVFDMLTALYYVRTNPLPEKGEVYFDIVNAGKEYPLKVVVHGRETVKVKAGKFNCVLVEPEINGEGIFVSKGKSLKVWLTDDEYKMPVKMTVEVFIGSVKAELTQYTR